MSSRTFRRRVVVGGLLVVSVVGLCAVPVSAEADATGKCMWYDADIPPAPGSPTLPFQDCGLHSGQTAEATYYWSDEARVIIEPQALAFDYSAFGGLDPFSTEYTLSKANELFPDTSRLTDAIAKATYAQNALTTKARAIESRGKVATRDSCIVVPTRFTDAEIATGTDGWLPPTPTPDGGVGTYTYSLSANLTAAQRADILAGLVTFDEARSGSQQPKLVEWQPGSKNLPVITFQNAPGPFDNPATTAEAQPVVFDEGRDGLIRWVNGNISLSPEDGVGSAWTVVHEILHVYGFRHNSVPTESEVMSPSTKAGVIHNIWEMTGEPTPVIHGKVDSCTKEGIKNAAAPE